MNTDKYSLSRLLLTFSDKTVEQNYQAHITGRMLLFCRIAWALFVFFGLSFAFLDRQVFGNKGDMVLMVRLPLVSLAGVMLALTYSARMRKLLHLNASFFIMLIGFFSTFLVAMSSPTEFTPYFTSFLFAFAGIFTILGLGFKFSIFAMTLCLLVFEITVGLIKPVPLKLFLVYTFFLSGIFITYAYIGYMAELFSRESYAMSERLKDSLAEIKTLSGLLPICSHCKKIRDDGGYWSQVDEYFRDHGNVTFSHSLCPDCAAILYPTLKI